MSLSSDSWVHDADSNCTLKVDSIKWVRQDCIILGCLPINEDGKEIGYFVQIIASKDGKISEASSKPVLLLFRDVFFGISDDIVPSGCGPYLFLNYLKRRELAVVANRKNTEQHIMLFGWSCNDEQKEVTLMDIQEDRWLPRIPLQENEDENLIMGFGVDNISLCEKVEVMLGAEPKEFSPYCVLMCLTLDGRLLMFYVAGSTENLDPTQISSGIIDEEEDSLGVAPLSCDSSTNFSKLVEQEAVEIVLDTKSLDMNQNELEAKGEGGVQKESDAPNDLKPPCDVYNIRGTSNSFGASSDPVGRSQGPLQLAAANKELNSFGNFPASLKEGQQNANLGPASSQQSADSQKSTANSPLSHGLDSVLRDAKKLETQKPIFSGLAVGTGTDNLARNIPNTFQLNYKDPVGSGEGNKGFTGNIGTDVSRSAASQGSLEPLTMEDLKSRFSSPEHNMPQPPGSRTGGAGPVPGREGPPMKHPFSNVSNEQDPNAATQSPISSSGRPTHLGGQRLSAGVGKCEPVPSILGTQVESHGGSRFENSFKFKMQPTQENLRPPQSFATPRLEPELSKHFGSVKEMAMELDTLLSYIEGKGGFMDACTVSQKSSVLALEQALENLSDRCRVWKNTMGEQLKQMEHLLDRTVQVFARKIYMEGIVKQAADSQYWDIWNRQKLSPELEMRRKQILKVNQDLTNQLIELERHFNTLEHSQFGENSGAPMDHRMSGTSTETSRHGQSFQRLYSTMNSQLAAAEQLAECLTKQMAALNVESPFVKRQSVAKELFESIGLAYDGDFFNSPNVRKSIHTPESIKKFPLSSYSNAIKEQSRRNPSSAIKTFEPETARRRRDSLGQSWASFEPPKATVKRMMLQEEYPRVSPNKLSSATNADIQGKILKQATPSSSFNWVNGHSGESIVLEAPMLQVIPRSTHQSHPSLSTGESASSSSKMWNDTNETSSLVSDRSSPTVIQFGKFDHPDVQSGSLSKSRVTSQIKATLGSINRGAILNETSSAVPVKNQNIPFPSSSDAPPAFSLHDKLFQVATVTSKAQASIQMSTVPPTSVVSSSVTSPPPQIPSPTPPAVSANQLLHPAFSSSISFKETEAIAPLASSFSSVSSTPSVVSFRPCTSQAPDEQVPPSASSASMKSTNQVPPAAPKPPVGEFNLKENVNSTSQAPASQIPGGQFTLKSEMSVTSAAPSKFSVDLSSGSQPSLTTTSFTSTATAEPSVQLNSQPESPSVEPVRFPEVASTSSVATDGKNESLDLTAIQEDEMEEEATDTIGDLSLGTLDSVGLASASMSATPKPNPFGAPFPNAAPSLASSPFDLRGPTGELFRPASFSFQSIQPSQSSQPTNPNTFSGSFNTAATVPEPTKSVFGHPANIGAGQQALGSVLGSFGQSRQLGNGLPGASFSSPSGIGGGGFAAAGKSGGGFGTPGGFANASTGGFAGVGSTGGGFAGVASGSGGFAAAASGGGGFAGVATAGGFGATASGGGGFGAAAPGVGGFSGASGAGGGFGGFSNKQGGSAFSAFGNSSAGSTKPPSELFTQIRR